MSLDIGVDEIIEKLSKREKSLDIVLGENRQVVRSCSNAIKAMHGHDMETAKKHLDEAETQLKKISPYADEFPSQLNHVYQEYAEARIILSAIEEKKIPSYKELNLPGIPFLLGLLDAIGELKREVYVSLSTGNKDEAKIYFKMMEDIYDELLPMRFSNSILPEFRRKQDVVRLQIEQARGQLL